MRALRTFSILTLGCKVNQYESAQIRQFLEEKGLSLVQQQEKPDLCVINTCCVTATASAKSRQFIQRAKRLNKQAEIIICGCLTAQKTTLGTSDELPLPDNNTSCRIVVKDMLAYELTRIIEAHLSENSVTNTGIPHQSTIKPEIEPKIKSFAGLPALPQLPLLTNFKEQTRAFLKVQDGCDSACSYCIIPKVRPQVRSKPICEAVLEAKALVKAGHKEIVVTGVNLGAYGSESCRSSPVAHDSRPLSVLLERLAEIEELKRLRVSSLEPGDINEDLLAVFCAHKNIMPHIHLSVQSGSGRILKRMCRPYSAAELREKISLIKRRLDRPALTCDIIVGFPGETDEDFQQTLELSKWAEFSKIHVFPFSSREGTAAAKMKNKLPSKVIKHRAEILRKLGDELGYKFRSQFIGETCEALLEDTQPPSGRCERYFVVRLGARTQNQSHSVQDIITVKITSVTETGTEGEENFQL